MMTSETQQSCRFVARTRSEMAFALHLVDKDPHSSEDSISILRAARDFARNLRVERQSVPL